MVGLDETRETIVAVATAPGPASRGIVRASGPGTHDVVRRLFANPAVAWPTTDTAVDVQLRINGLARPVAARLLVWSGSSGFTGQPAVEIHTLGNPPLLDALVRALCELGARLARPGEFALRAFLAGKLDLMQAEAILGLIDAEDRAEFGVALSQMSGGMAGPLDQIRDELIDVLALIEAGLDFVEEDIEFVGREELLERLARLGEHVASLLEQVQRRSTGGALPTVVLVGPPNVGKSSLFNALIEREASIVAPVAGTTRDYLGAVLTLGECGVRLVDTAGLQSAHPVEDSSEIARLAQHRSREQAQRATLQLVCTDASTEPDSPATLDSVYTYTVCDQLAVFTKCDQSRRAEFPPGSIATSAWTGHGLGELRGAVARMIAQRLGTARDVIPATATRCAESLRQIATAVDAAIESARTHASDELVASDLRVALEYLGQIVGAIHTDDILDRVFSRFCIGK